MVSLTDREVCKIANDPCYGMDHVERAAELCHGGGGFEK